MNLCFFGAYDPDYPRNLIIRKGLKANGIEVFECGVAPKFKIWLRYPLLFFRSRRGLKKCDILFVPEFAQKDMPLARFLSSLFRKKLVFDPLAARFETKILDWKRKPANSWQARWNYKIDSWALRRGDLILADTQAHKDYYCRQYGLNAQRVEVLRVGFDSDRYRPSPAAEEGFTVLFFGSFLPLHGVMTIIRAARILAEEDSSIQLRLIGSGQTLPEAKALARSLSLPNVCFEGWQSQSILPGEIASASVCLGIFGEGEKTQRVIPHKIYQALGMKKPVITLRTPAVEEIFTHGKNMFMCAEPVPSELARAVLTLRRDSELRKRIADEGYLLVSQHFSPEAIGRELIKILKRHFNLPTKEANS